MNNSALHSSKQRGIYSEMIIPDNSVSYQNQPIAGPDESLYINTQQRQKIPKANALPKKDPAFNLNSRATQKRKTMEKLEKIIVKIGQDEDFDLRVEPKVNAHLGRSWSPTIPSPDECPARWPSTARRRSTRASASTSSSQRKVHRLTRRHRLRRAEEGVLDPAALLRRLDLRRLLQRGVDREEDRRGRQPPQAHRQGPPQHRERL